MTEADGFSSKPFYDSDLPATMRFKHEGAERGAPFDPALHLTRLIRMVEQPFAAEEDGDSLDLVRAEIEALVEKHPELQEQLERH